METISQRITNKTLDSTPNDIVIAIGDEIDRMVKDGDSPEKAIFVATAKLVKQYAGYPPDADGNDIWFKACVDIASAVYGMVLLRHSTLEIPMVMKQSKAGVYRGIIDIMIEKLASVRAKNYPVLDE